MKKVRFTETQNVNILKLTDSGMKVDDICRQNGISNATYYNWKSKYGGMEANDVKRLKELEDENTKLKKMFAEVSLENHAMKELFGKKGLVVAEKKSCAQSLKQAGLSVIKACQLTSLSRTTFYRQPVDWRKKDGVVIDAIQTVLAKSPQSGFWKCYFRLRFQGYPFNHKRVYRVYCRLAEQDADRFASAFLMPERSILASIPRMPKLDHLILLKKNWKVSLAALVRRTFDVGLSTEWHYRQLSIELNRRGFRTGEPQGMPEREKSLILEKVFSTLRTQGIKRTEILEQLRFPPDEVNALTFNNPFFMKAITGAGFESGIERNRHKPQLQLVK
ncbi:transposase [Proteus mirabilis]|uniref:transposase n=1 Tax=Proteus mirabilis TaxID=584 RepID=UPI0035C820B9